MALPRVRGGALVLTLVRGPLLCRAVGPPKDAVVLLEDVVRSLLQLGGLPRGLLLLFEVIGCAGSRFGLGSWVSLSLPLSASCGCSTAIKGSGPLWFPVCELNKRKLLRVSVRDGLDNSGADVPEGDGTRLLVGSSG